MNNKLAIGMALALGCAPAIGAEFQSGFYAGIGIGDVTLEDSIETIDIEASDTGFKLFGGYRFNQHFAVEAAFIDGGNPEDTVVGVTFESDASAFQASAVGTLPISDRFGAYLRAGILSWESENSATNGFDTFVAETDGTDFSYGIGAIFNVTGNFSLRGEFEGADLDGTDLRLLSLSGLFSF